GARGAGGAVGGGGRPGEALEGPNDDMLAAGKVGGILGEGRPQEGWAVIGVGVNVAVRLDELPAELHGRAGTLGLGPEAIEPTLERLMGGLERWTGAGGEAVLEAVRVRDALRGRHVRW